jgi:superoxide dismutase, Fe-Mn family
MLSIATRNAIRPTTTTLARSLAIRASSVHTLPALPYAYNVRPISSQSLPSSIHIHTRHPIQALEPHISEEIMKLHHTKHHQTYVNGLNAAEESYAKAKGPKEQIALQAALKFNGGGTCLIFSRRLSFSLIGATYNTGHINHSLFWTNLGPASNPATSISSAPALSKAIEETFGSFDSFKKTFNAKTAAVQGSGWGWLVSRFFLFFFSCGKIWSRA